MPILDSNDQTLVVGVDAGGTVTRALLANLNGEVICSGQAEGANRWSSAGSPADTLGAVLTETLAGYPPERVRHGVIGLAGGAGSDDARRISEAWSKLGLRGRPQIVHDALIAFAAGTTVWDGVVLVAGTGSVAAAIAGAEIGQIAGGAGWMIGDEGSAVWLGLQGLRAVIRAQDARGERTLLEETLPGILLGTADPQVSIAQIVATTHGMPPARLGRLAPAILAAAVGGDAVATEIVDQAVRELANALFAVSAHTEPSHVVLSGAVVTAAELIPGQIAACVAKRWPNAEITSAASGEVGAAAMAIASLTGAPITEAVHRRLTVDRGTT